MKGDFDMLDYIDIGEGEELVLIHGLGNRIDAWIPQLSLSLNYRLVLIELRGHGNSVEVEDLTVERFAKDIIEVLDFLNIKKAHFCGLSLGGIVAQEIYKRFKARVKTLILSNTTFYVPNVVSKMSMNKAKYLIEQIGFDNYHINSVKTCLYNYEDERTAELAKKAFHIREDTYFKSIQAASGRNYFFNLLTISVPTLIIGSFEDKVTPVQSAIIMNYFIRTSRLVLFEKAGHLSNIEKAEEFNEAIEKHLIQYKTSYSKVS